MAIRQTLAFSVCVLALSGGNPAGAESLRDALVSAYQKNPVLNAARAATRAADEGVPQALGGYRPKVSLFGGLNAAYTATGNSNVYNGLQYAQGGLQVSQSIYDGGRREASTTSAEASVLASQAQLLSSEQTVLQQAVEAYVNVIQYSALLRLQDSNVAFLSQQVKAAQDKLNVGQGTKTDVAQAQAQFAAGQAAQIQARAVLKAARAVYAQVIGHQPGALSESGFGGLTLPASADLALTSARNQHPAIKAAAKAVDVAEANVDIQASALKPQVSVTANALRNAGHGGSAGSAYGVYNSAAVTANVTIPLYEGGVAWSAVRQAKEALSQARLQLDAARMSVDAGVISAWGNLEAARGSVTSGQAQVAAARLALDGVIAEQQVGQKTTLDVLNAQTTLVTAQSNFVTSQRNAIAFSYALLGAVGHLNATDLGLPVAAYDPGKHYNEVHDKWFGLRNSDD